MDFSDDDTLISRNTDMGGMMSMRNDRSVGLRLYSKHNSIRVKHCFEASLVSSLAFCALLLFALLLPFCHTLLSSIICAVSLGVLSI